MKIYSKIDKTIKLFGLTLSSKVEEYDKIKRKRLFGLIKSYTTLAYKKIYFLGIQVYRKNKQPYESPKLNEILNNIHFYHSMSRATEKLHSAVFPQFKNKHKGGTAVLIATGPTLLHYSRLKNCIHLCVNNAYKKITPDYWFAIDAQNIANRFPELQQTDFVKFYGQCITPAPLHRYRSEDKETIYHIADNIIENSKNCYKFYFDHPSLRVNRDIETQPLPDLGSCVFSALYFAIYAGIKRIYVVGCDCACNGYFDGQKQKPVWDDGSVVAKLLRGWNIFKDYVEVFHPDVEIISINPVGLTGLFRDVYTKSYLEEHPEIDPDSVEILDEIEAS
jgi:hypothetical protein